MSNKNSGNAEGEKQSSHKKKWLRTPEEIVTTKLLTIRGDVDVDKGSIFGRFNQKCLRVVIFYFGITTRAPGFRLSFVEFVFFSSLSNADEAWQNKFPYFQPKFYCQWLL